MSTEHSPETTNTPSTAPAETGAPVDPVGALAEKTNRNKEAVTADAAAKTDEVKADINTDVALGQSNDVAISVGRIGSTNGAPQRTVTTGPEKSTWAAFVDTLSGGWDKVMEFLKTANKGISDFFRNVLGLKKEEADKATVASEKPKHEPERPAEDSELISPGAPVFSFLKESFPDGGPYITDVPRIRPEHPKTHKKNVPHEGWDIDAKPGTPIFLTAPATFISAENDKGGGLIATVLLKNGHEAKFMHLSKVAPFKQGDVIPKNAWLANTGNSGVSTGPHLHFQIDGGSTDLAFLDPGLATLAQQQVEDLKQKGLWKALT